MHWRCLYCHVRFYVPDKRNLTASMVGHMFARHRCRDIRRGLRCLLVAGHQHQHHVYVEGE